MVPHVRMKQLPKGLSKQDRHKYELKYNEEYLEFIHKNRYKAKNQDDENEDED